VIMSMRSVVRVSVVAVLVLAAAACRTSMDMRVLRMSVEEVRPNGYPESQWFAPSLVVDFTCDDVLLAFAKDSEVMIRASCEYGDLIGGVYCRGVVSVVDVTQYYDLGFSRDKAVTLFLGVCDFHGEDKLLEAMRGGAISEVRLVVRAVGKPFVKAESNTVTMVRQHDGSWREATRP
jgi:hypothetical protein